MSYILKTLLANRANYGKERSLSKIKYLVCHYTGNDGDSDEANGKYFHNNKVYVSAHDFVDGNSVTNSVPYNYIAWHCGGGLQGSKGHAFWLKCTNTNSIGMEMCDEVKNGKYDFSDATINNAVEHAKYLMNKFNIPIDNVIRHYDVTGKICPKPFVDDEGAWWNFKAKLEGKQVSYIPAQATGLSVVKEWQTVMNKVYGSGLAIDGSYGPASQGQANKHYLSYRKPVTKNAYVGFIQKRLNYYGISCEIDNSFGPATKKAVIKFQKKKGLKADGMVGANTLRKLLGL